MNCTNPYKIGVKFFIVFTFLLVLNSCNDYGKKITFPGTKGEVFYKGKGVTEADATAVGKFLEAQQFFVNDKKRSVQISKDGNRIKARFMLDKKALDSIQYADDNFAVLAVEMSRNVFNDLPVDIIYTDNVFKDYKTIPYKPAVAAQVATYEEIKHMQRKDYLKNSMYFDKAFSEPESKTMFEYFIKSGFFSPDGNNVIIVSKTQDNAIHFKFPINAANANAEGFQKIDVFAKALKKDLFARVPMQFEALNENLLSIKTFGY